VTKKIVLWQRQRHLADASSPSIPSLFSCLRKLSPSKNSILGPPLESVIWQTSEAPSSWLFRKISLSKSSILGLSWNFLIGLLAEKYFVTFSSTTFRRLGVTLETPTSPGDAEKLFLSDKKLVEKFELFCSTAEFSSAILGGGGATENAAGVWVSKVEGIFSKISSKADL